MRLPSRGSVMTRTVWCPLMGTGPSRLFFLALFLCRTIVCDTLCPKFAERPLETRVQDASIVFRAVVVQTYFAVSLFFLYNFLETFILRSEQLLKTSLESNLPILFVLTFPCENEDRYFPLVCKSYLIIMKYKKDIM